MKNSKTIKHTPQRTCAGCRKVLAKRSLVRLVRTPEGVRIDPTGKQAGRGTYLHNQRSCWEAGLKGAIARTLKVELTVQDQEILKAYLANLPQEPIDEPSSE